MVNLISSDYLTLYKIMKIPKQLKVGAHLYDVEFKPTGDREKGRDNWARTYLADKKMIIDSNLPRSQQEETFVHELMHCVFHHTRLSDDIWDKKELNEEQIVNRSSVALYQILKENNLLK